MESHLPNEVTLVYREVGNSHVFTAAGIVGLVHVGSCDRKKAFDNAFVALSTHVSMLTGKKVSYVPDRTYEDFAEHVGGNDLSSNFITARKQMNVASASMSCGH